MTDSDSDSTAAGSRYDAEATEQQHPRRRRRSASRPFGPPQPPTLPDAALPAEPARPSDPVVPTDPILPTDQVVSADQVVSSPAEAPINDPVERSDRRRQRRQKAKRTRAERDAEAAATAGATPSPHEREAGSPQPDRSAAPDRDRRRNGSERALRGLEGGRDTQISTTDAMRAREWAAPSADDLAEADRDVVLVRRHYRPPAPLQTTRRRGGPDPDHRPAQDAGST